MAEILVELVEGSYLSDLMPWPHPEMELPTLPISLLLDKITKIVAPLLQNVAGVVSR